MRCCFSWHSSIVLDLNSVPALASSLLKPRLCWLDLRWFYEQSCIYVAGRELCAWVCPETWHLVESQLGICLSQMGSCGSNLLVWNAVPPLDNNWSLAVKGNCKNWKHLSPCAELGSIMVKDKLSVYKIIWNLGTPNKCPPLTNSVSLCDISDVNFLLMCTHKSLLNITVLANWLINDHSNLWLHSSSRCQ